MEINLSEKQGVKSISIKIEAGLAIVISEELVKLSYLTLFLDNPKVIYHALMIELYHKHFNRHSFPDTVSCRMSISEAYAFWHLFSKSETKTIAHIAYKIAEVFTKKDLFKLKRNSHEDRDCIEQ